jgi:DNA-binding response OmpR family regulator
LSPKEPIGKILCEKKKITQDQLGEALERSQQSGEKLASSLLEMGVAGEEDLLNALIEQHGMPGIDLSKSVIPLSSLDLIPESVAEGARILPLHVTSDEVVLAISDPGNQNAIDEVEFVTGKKVRPYVVLDARLKNSIKAAYALKKRGGNDKYFRGDQAVLPGDQEFPDGYLHIVSKELPEPDVSIPPEPIPPESPNDEELITIEVSSDDEIVPGLPESAMVSPAVTGEQAGQTILVVDDEPDIVNILQKALASAGFRVISASRGLEALQKVKRDKPDLVLLDAMLPEIHGFEICKKIKTSKRFGNIPVIMISAVYKGWRFAEDVKSTYGADDYFEKPFRLVPLLRRVGELLKTKTATDDSIPDPQAANRAYQKGILEYKKGQFEQAEKSLIEAVNLDPFSANTHYALANVYVARNRVYEAIKEFEQTVELKPDLFAPLRNLAILYQKKGFKNKAIEMWERALRSSPNEETKQEVRNQLLKLL